MVQPTHSGYRPTLWERLADAPHPSVSFQSSFWHASAPPGPETERLEGELRARTVVVGGGYLGFSTALHLAEAGEDVTLLEADEPGFGASGRNTGFAVPNLLTGIDPRTVCAAFGEERGMLLCRTLGEGAELIFELVRRHGIDCQARQTGWMQPLHTAAKAAWLDDRIEQWKALGRPVQRLSRDEAVYETGSNQYHGAFLDPTGGHLNPLAYARGLATAAIRAGTKVFTDSRATRLERVGDIWRIETAHGVLIADRVLLTTNASGGGLAPDAEGTQFPITLFQVATAPLDPELRKSVLPNDRCSADTRKDLIAYRWTWDNRLVTGGLLANPVRSSARGRTHHVERLRRLLPQLPPLTVDYAWQGRLAAARDYMPRLMELGPNAWSAVACNGRGMAMTTALGRAFALWLAGGSNEGLPVPITRPDPVLLPGLASLAFSLWLPLSRWRDQQDLKGQG
jgi:glycine/D-amino acid oxidase-like deaminating enzyme